MSSSLCLVTNITSLLELLKISINFINLSTLLSLIINVSSKSMNKIEKSISILDGHNKDIKENTKFLKSNMCESTIDFYNEIIS